MAIRGRVFAIEEGERVVLVGANGSGKSTLLHVVAGGAERREQRPARRPYVVRHRCVLAKAHERALARSKAARSLAAAWSGSPRLLVLDEPTNALDGETRAAVLARICEGTALIATHDLELAKVVATRIVSVEAGVLRG